jgi:hypothetical protein
MDKLGSVDWIAWIMMGVTVRFRRYLMGIAEH